MAENRLASQASSYLQSAAHQPVDWFPWGAEAFDKARREDKPILLDIGAVWCHWCHVMDRESYESEAIAEVLNREYVCVKVDRDERPDVDTRYQKAVQAMIGQGGWPLTVFLLPDGRPFYGGTYYPPVDAHGRPSFGRVLTAVADAFRNRRGEILESAGNLGAHLAQQTPRAGPGAHEGGHGHSAEDALAHGVSHIRETFDEAQGGFGRAPKFPHPAAHDFLLAVAARGDRPARAMAVATLDRMRAGGIYDQLAGGFHRYSVDRIWRVPHFEKMLYDNAGLLRNYARAGGFTGRAELTETAREIAGWMRDVLAQPGGGFGGSQDADVGLDDDGDYFTWTLDELKAAVPDERLQRVAALHFGVTENGDMHHNPAKNVLHVEADVDALAAGLHRPVAEVRVDLARAVELMRAARAQRQAPFVDPTRYTNWNGMAIQALLELGGVTGEREWDDLALHALDAFLAQAYDPARGFSRAIGSEVFGILDDNAQMLDALLEAHLATGHERYLDAARQVADLLITRFAHPAGGFQDRAPTLAPDAEAPTLELPDRPIQDSPTASPNGVALRALLRLSEATGTPRYREVAAPALEALRDDAAHMGVFAGALLLALDDLLHPPQRVETRGDEAARWARPLVRRLAKPGAVLVQGGVDLPQEGALVCLGDRCLAPAFDETQLRARLGEG